MSADEDHEMELKAAENPQKNVTHKPCETLTNNINNIILNL